MHDVPTMSRSDARRNPADELPGTLRRHRSFDWEYVLSYSPYKFHDQKVFVPRTTPKSVTDDVLMTYGRGRKCFRRKARGEHRIVTDQIRQDDFAWRERF